MADEDEQDALRDVVDDTADDEGGADGKDKGEGGNGADSDEDATDDDSDDDGEDGDDDAAADAKAVEQKPAAAADEADDDDDDARPFIPRYEAPAVEDYDTKIKDLSTQRAAVIAKFKAGEIESDAMDQELEALDSKRSELDRARTKAEIAAETQAQAADQQWKYEISRFMRSASKEGVEYRIDSAQAALDEARKSSDAAAINTATINLRRTKMMNAALDTVVKELANDDANADRPSSWFLEEAHRQVKEQFNIKTATRDAPKPKIPARKPDLRSIPKTLADVPSAGSDDASTGDDEFAHLDKLEGLDLERAVAKMSEAQKERWARSAA